MFGLFKPKAKTEPNPWLKIEHPHDWLPANDGKELVCGMCGLRRNVNEGKTDGKRSKARSRTSSRSRTARGNSPRQGLK